MAKALKVKPHGRKLLMSIPETKTGSLVVQQGAQIQEIGTVIAVGKEIDPKYYQIKVGDTLHFKAWAVDIITVDGEKFYYLDADSDAICGIVTK